MSAKPPRYLRQRCTGRTYCRLRGAKVYLGIWKSPESRRKFAEAIDRWRRDDDGKQAIGKQSPADEHLTVSGLLVRFLEYAASY